MILEETLVPNIETKVPEEPETPEPSLREQIEETAKEISTRERDEVGRFASKKTDPTGTVVEKPLGLDKAAKPAAEAPTALPETPERPTLAPNAWSHQAKAAFANADPLIKAEIARREADIHKEFTKQDGERNFGRAIQQIAAPYAQIIQAEGGDPVKAFKGYLETTRILKQGDPQTKARLGRMMFEQFGIDPRMAFGDGSQVSAQPAVAPAVQMLQNEVADLKAQVSRSNSYAETQALAPLHAQVDAFAADPANTHYEAVKPLMASLLQSGQAQSLQDAYDMAVWARPDIRSSLTAQHSAAEAQRVAEAKRAKADAARRAGGSITGSPGLGASSDPKAGQRDLRAELEANFASARI